MQDNYLVELPKSFACKIGTDGQLTDELRNGVQKYTGQNGEDIFVCDLRKLSPDEIRNLPMDAQQKAAKAFPGLFGAAPAAQAANVSPTAAQLAKQPKKNKKGMTILIVVLAVFGIAALSQIGKIGKSSGSVVPYKSSSGTSYQTSGSAAPKSSSSSSASAEYKITDTSVRIWSNSIGTPWIQAIVEITNTGSVPLYLGEASYDLEDDSGKLLESHKYVSCYPDIIYPGEVGYMYDEALYKGEAVEKVSIVPRIEIEPARSDAEFIKVDDMDFSRDSDGELRILGHVTNNTGEEQSLVYVVAVVYDSNDKCVGLMFTILPEEIQPGETVSYELHPFAMPDDVDAKSAEVFSYTKTIQF